MNPWCTLSSKRVLQKQKVLDRTQPVRGKKNPSGNLISQSVDLDGEFVITFGAWRLSHSDTLTALYILETKQIKNAWWSGTYLEFSVVTQGTLLERTGGLQLTRGGLVYTFSRVFSPMTWFLTWWMRLAMRLVSTFLNLYVIHMSYLNERSDLPEVRKMSLGTTAHSSLS